MMYYAAPLILLGLLNILLGILVTFRDRRRVSNVSFFGLAFSTGIWCMGIGALYVTYSNELAFGWARLYYLAPIVLVYCLVLLAFTFPDEKISKLKLWVYSIPSQIFIIALILSPNFLIQTLNRTSSNWQAQLNYKHYNAYGVYLAIYFAIGLIVLFKKGRKATLQATQASLLFIGLTISAVFGVFFNLILPGLGNYNLIWVGPLASTMFVAVVAYSIARYRMFDIRMFVLRSMAYMVTTIVLAILYVAPILYATKFLTGVSYDLPQLLILVVVGTLLATNYNRLKQWFNKISSKYFFRETYEPAELIADLNKALVNTIDVKKLLISTSKIVETNLKPEYCYFLINNTENRDVLMVAEPKLKIPSDTAFLLCSILNKRRDRSNIFVQAMSRDDADYNLFSLHDIAAVIRLSHSGLKIDEKIGYMVIGVKKSGKGYDLQDMQVLDAIANTLVIAIQNAMHFEEIQQFNATLQQRVEEQTRKYRTANEKLKKLDETKDEFISMASHQLRTPLTSVKGYLSMVLEGDAGKLNKQQEELLKQSFMSSERMVNLIADLLNLSRLNTGKFVIESAPTDLRDVVDQELAQLRESAAAKNITLHYEPPKTFPLLELDTGKIHQVVMNFIDNALYYTPPGGTVTVSLSETPSAVEFRVQDTGIGVPRALQHRLFSKFYRADNARRMRPDGTGLGLFMAKKVIIAHGGSVVFDSEESKGSTFGFRFGKKRQFQPVAVQADD